jgi:putative toxin-antitoxin system antitoxin component (TIGR02293 family)
MTGVGYWRKVTPTRSRATTPTRQDAIRKRAAVLQGGDEPGDRWLNTPAPALDGRTPGNVMKQSDGADLVEQLLIRLEYGVYS